MGEIKFYRQEVQVNYACPKCESGYMWPDGFFDNSFFNTTFNHVCEKCGHEEELSKVYPATEVEFIKKEMR